MSEVRKPLILYIVPDLSPHRLLNVMESLSESDYVVWRKNHIREGLHFRFEIVKIDGLIDAQSLAGYQVQGYRFGDGCYLGSNTLNYLMSRIRPLP